MAKKKTAKLNADDARIQKILSNIRKKFGEDSALTVSDAVNADSQVTEFLPTGIDVVDRYVLGTGGLPVGRISEWYSQEGGGKTSFMLQTFAQTQARGGVCVLLDGEQSWDAKRARQLGVKTDKLIIEQPDYLEDVYEMLKITVRTMDGTAPILIGLDSMASMNSKAGFSAEAGDAKVGDVSRINSQELKKIHKLLGQKRAHFMIINQIRAKIGVMFGPNETTPGGNAPKFYASNRVQLFSGKSVKSTGGKHIAKIVTFLSTKNRFAPPYAKARIRFDYATGYNNFWSTIEHAKREKVINPREKGFTGKGKKGPKAYAEACKALGWSSDIAASGSKGDQDDGDDGEDFDFTDE